MGYAMRVSLPGYDCLTDTTTDHYALYTDEDYLLIKEKARGSVNLSSGGGGTVVNHALGYIPFFLSYGSASFSIGTHSVNGWFLCSPGFLTAPNYAAITTTQDLVLQNNSSANATFKYFIFYDNQES